MKTFDQLTDKEQSQAIKQCLNELVGAVCMGSIRFDDDKNQDGLQARIDKAIAKAEEMQTPWFTSEYLLDDATIESELMAMAIAEAEDALYNTDNKHIITLKGV